MCQESIDEAYVKPIPPGHRHHTNFTLSFSKKKKKKKEEKNNRGRKKKKRRKRAKKQKGKKRKRKAKSLYCCRSAFFFSFSVCVGKFLFGKRGAGGEGVIKEIKRQLVPLREMQGIVSPSNKAKKTRD